MKKAIVTGAGSTVGGALIKELVTHEVEVLAIVRKGSARKQNIVESPLVKVVECDLDGMKELGAEGSYDVFYHLAWAHTAKETRDNPILQQENIGYTLDAVELAHRLGCSRFIGAGSQAEYGIVHDVITPETPVHPEIAYGMAKYAAGRLSAKLCQQLGLEQVWARIFSVYGIHDSAASMLSYAIRQFMAGEDAYFSAGTQMWDFLHEDEVGKILYLLGEKPLDKDTYCVSDGRPRPLREFILEAKEVFEAETGRKASIHFDAAIPPATVTLRPDISALTAAIGYAPTKSFSQGIKEIIQAASAPLS